MLGSLAKHPVATKSVVIALLIASPWLVVQLGIIVLAPDDEITAMPNCESTSGNCAHLGGGEDYRLEQSYATMLNYSAESVYDNLRDYISDYNHAIIFENNDQVNYFVHFVEKTKFWQFPDDVVVSIQQLDEGCLIEIHSESRLGWGDIGLNPERIDRIYQHLS